MKIRLEVVVAILVVAVAGCSSPHTATVTGIVKLDGQPLDSGSVVFFPVEDGPVPSGVIASDGRYTLAIGSSKSRGIPPGDYVAVVTAVAKQAPGSQNPPPTIIPPKYMDRSKSPLKFTLEPGPNTCDLILEK